MSIPPKYRANTISCEADGARQIPEDELAEYNRNIMLESEMLLRERQDRNDMVTVKGVDLYRNLLNRLKHAYLPLGFTTVTWHSPPPDVSLRGTLIQTNVLFLPYLCVCVCDSGRDECQTPI